MIWHDIIWYNILLYYIYIFAPFTLRGVDANEVRVCGPLVCAVWQIHHQGLQQHHGLRQARLEYVDSRPKTGIKRERDIPVNSNKNRGDKPLNSQSGECQSGRNNKSVKVAVSILLIPIVWQTVHGFSALFWRGSTWLRCFRSV